MFPTESIDQKAAQTAQRILYPVRKSAREALLESTAFAAVQKMANGHNESNEKAKVEIKHLMLEEKRVRVTAKVDAERRQQELGELRKLIEDLKFEHKDSIQKLSHDLDAKHEKRFQMQEAQHEKRFQMQEAKYNDYCAALNEELRPLKKLSAHLLLRSEANKFAESIIDYGFSRHKATFRDHQQQPGAMGGMLQELCNDYDNNTAKLSFSDVEKHSMQWLKDKVVGGNTFFRWMGIAKGQASNLAHPSPLDKLDEDLLSEDEKKARKALKEIYDDFIGGNEQQDID